MKISKQKENIKNLLQLIKENPDLPIIPMVDAEIVCDDCGYWMGSWGQAKVDEYYLNEEHVYFKEDCYDKLVEDWIDINYEDFPNKTGVELEEIAKTYVESYNWIKAIIVYIQLP